MRLPRDVDDIDVVGEAADGTAAVALARDRLPDVMLMDVRMQGTDDIDATAGIVRDRPEVRVLVLTTFDLDEAVHRALRAGASGFLLKDTPYDQLVHAIRVGVRRLCAGSVGDPSTDRVVHPGPHGHRGGGRPARARRTDREQEVLGRVADGLYNAEIGARLSQRSCRPRTRETRGAAIVFRRSSLPTGPGSRPGHETRPRNDFYTPVHRGDDAGPFRR